MAGAAPPRAGRLLVVAPNWLGDLVMATPALDRLAGARAAGWLLALALPAPWAPLFAGDPRCDTLLIHDRAGRHRGAPGAARLARAWRTERADAVVLMPPSLRVAVAAWLARIPVRIGQRTDGRQLLLTHAVARGPRGSRHFSDELLDLVAAWERSAGLAAPPAAPAAPSLPGCARFPRDPRLGDGRPTWALAAGATYGDAKSWPPRRLAAFAALATEEQGVRLLLLGDAAARPAAEAARSAGGAAWRDEIAGGPGVVDLVGRTSLTEVVGLLRGSGLFVGNDSGLMHLAAALGVPTLGLFGSTSPAWTAPRGARAAVVTAAGFACSPCFRRRCPLTTFCLDTVAPDAVLAAARALLAGPAEGGVA